MTKLNSAKQAAKAATIQKFQIHAADTGTPEVQVALLTKDINQLVDHLKVNPKDNSSRRGLLKKVGTRKTHLRYLQTNDPKRYAKVVAAHKLKSAA
jgi:small subunit ribosomal protein S15